MIAKLTVTKQITNTQMEAIRQKLSDIAQENVTLQTVIDDAIIGGFVAELNGKIYDCSLKTRLKELQSYLKVAENDNKY
ncbi:MAG: F0F1 ATP synthase subunit delta [Clostridia bacterium]|nr:F0F1 ATP synthase subunit delta [Clostridia bacterium]